MRKTYSLLILPILALCADSLAATIEVSVLSHTGKPVNQVVVYLQPTDPDPQPPPQQAATMDQINSQFVPHILVVQRGTEINFPNSDSIKHHVYSFSSAKTFELPLYKGVTADPLAFDNNGLVELGCNVHDWMLGYIYVVDTPYFGKTSEDGKVAIEVPDGDYQIAIRHPRIQDAPEGLSRAFSISADTDGARQTLQFSLTKPLLEDLGGFEADNDDFSEYE